jgi:hypothetical protein
MKSGYFVHFTSHYRTSWIWVVILYALQRSLVLESDQKHNLILTLLYWFVILFLLYLVWPRRFMFSGNNFFFTKIFSAKLVQIDLKYVSAVKFGKFTFEFSYAGKHYRFLSVGSGLKLLKEKFNAPNAQEKQEKQEKLATK